MNKNSKILILGSRGLVGSAIKRQLQKDFSDNLLTPVREELDLFSQSAVREYFLQHKPTHVFLAAAKVGGIKANNTYRADFIHENIMIQSNVIDAAFRSDADRLLFLGSSCIYPKNAPQPMKEEYLLTSPLEPTNEPYAIAKIAGVKTIESFRKQYGKNWSSVMPTNLYGEYDNFHPENSHVIPGLIARMHKAKMNGERSFVVWGTGNPKREFLHVDDMASACIHLMGNESSELPDLINIGTGIDITIRELAFLIKKILGYEGEIVFNPEQPDGPLRKLLDVSKINALGWRPSISLEEGLKRAINFYLSSVH